MYYHGYVSYDYGSRGYYPAIGRFTSVDPLAEKYYSISPYAYCAGNPVRYIDPTGKWFWEAKNVRNARDEAKNSGGQFNKWTGQNGSSYASVDFSISYIYNGSATTDVKVFKPDGKSWGEKINDTRKDTQKWVKDNKSEIDGVAQSLQTTGDNTALAGLGMAAVGAPILGVGAAPGMTVIAFGGALSITGKAMEVGVEIITGDFSNNKTGNAVGSIIASEIINKTIDIAIPGPTPNIEAVLNETTKTLFNNIASEKIEIKSFILAR